MPKNKKHTIDSKNIVIVILLLIITLASIAIGWLLLNKNNNDEKETTYPDQTKDELSTIPLSAADLTEQKVIGHYASRSNPDWKIFINENHTCNMPSDFNGWKLYGCEWSIENDELIIITYAMEQVEFMSSWEECEKYNQENHNGKALIYNFDSDNGPKFIRATCYVPNQGTRNNFKVLVDGSLTQYGYRAYIKYTD